MKHPKLDTYFHAHIAFVCLMGLANLNPALSLHDTSCTSCTGFAFVQLVPLIEHVLL